MFGHLYKILWNLRNLVDLLLQYYQIYFWFIRFNPTGHKKKYQNFYLSQTGMNSVFIYKYTHSSLIYFIQNISSSLKYIQIAPFQFFIARKMICIFLVLCAILIFASMYGLFIGEFTPEEFTLNVGLLFYALFFLVIVCITNVNGSF